MQENDYNEQTGSAEVSSVAKFPSPSDSNANVVHSSEDADSEVSSSSSCFDERSFAVANGLLRWQLPNGSPSQCGDIVSEGAADWSGMARTLPEDPNLHSCPRYSPTTICRFHNLFASMVLDG